MRGPTLKGRPVIAIDGPAGAGKSSVAAHLAQRFGLLNLETGAMYRAFALKALQMHADPESESALLPLIPLTHIDLEPTTGGNRVLLDGKDVTAALRRPEVSAAASRVSVHPAIRHWMVQQQRLLGAAGGVVMEGRDIGTVVFPAADVKIFLDADPEIRGTRRFEQMDSATLQQTVSAVIEDLRDRDARDRNRAESPLQPAPGAVLLDSSRLSLAEVLQAAEQIVLDRSMA